MAAAAAVSSWPCSLSQAAPLGYKSSSPRTRSSTANGCRWNLHGDDVFKPSNSWSVTSVVRDSSLGYCNLRTGRSSRDAGACFASLDALIFDCDGVILESEDLHRQAYNLTFDHFNVKCSRPGVVHWDSEFYDVLQNTVGGGKPKMRWYFAREGWPSSTILDMPPSTDTDQGYLIDTLQDWKTSKYKELLSSGAEPRPGVLELMDEARSQEIKVAVCSAATKSSVVFCLHNLLGKERFDRLDCFLAGDDVKNKKPDPAIYNAAAEKLGARPDHCLVVEDSVIGLQAAIRAGMNCIISYTSSTAKQDFSGARATYPNLSGIGLEDLKILLEGAAAVTRNSGI